MRICECGCGIFTTVYKGKVRRFISGHNIQKGHVFSEETKRKLSESRMGYKMTPRHKAKAIKNLIPGQKTMLGKKLPMSTRMKMSANRKGDKHWNWQKGITPINTSIRHSWEYRQWRTAVFTRDNYTCVWCKRRGGVLHADHIKQFAYYPELRFSIDNGRTLCIECHTKTDTYKRHIQL